MIIKSTDLSQYFIVNTNITPNFEVSSLYITKEYSEAVLFKLWTDYCYYLQTQIHISGYLPKLFHQWLKMDQSQFLYYFLHRYKNSTYDPCQISVDKTVLSNPYYLLPLYFTIN